MANQILKTRINLKIDTLTNWNDSTLILGKGEVAIATASSSAGTGLTEPVCMIKIGDGEHTFSGLGWDFYAKSSDVLTACKTEKGLTDFVDGVIAKAGIASDDAMKALAAKVEAVEEDIKTLEGDENTAGSIANSIKAAIDALNLANIYATKNELEEAVDSLTEELETVASDAAQAATTAETNAKTYAETKASEAQAAAVAAAALDATSKADAAKAGAEATAASNLAAARTAISEEIDADVSALETALDTRLGVLEEIQHETFATKAEMEAETAVREAAEAQVLVDAQAYADEIKADLLGESDTLEGTYDTLREIAGWIATHEGETVVDLTEAIAAEAKAREEADNAFDSRIKAYEDVKDTYATKTEVATAKSEAEATATSKASAAETAAKAHADSITATAKAEAISTAALDATSKADAAKASAIDTAAADATAKANAAQLAAETTASADATAKANAAEAAAKTHADSKASAAETAAKAYADGLAGNYATSDQGGKADTALQSVSAGAGLKVSEKGNGTVQNISFDEECIFVFECGDSKTNIY